MDEKVASNFLKGSKRAFKQIFEEYSIPLSAFALRYLDDKQAVEDIIQEVFVTLWEDKNTCRGITHIKTYLYTSVRNGCLNYLKHENVKLKNKDSLTYHLESDALFENHVVEEETFSSLYSEIKNLPDSAQQIILLALNGLKNPEIADELGISVNTVKTQKKIAYAKLKDKLSPKVLSAYSVLFL